MRIVVWSHLEQEGAAVTRRLLHDFETQAVADKGDLPAALAGAAGLVMENSRFDADVAAWVAASPPRWIQLLSAGYENLVRHGVPPQVVVTNAAGVRSGAVAEHAMALLLGLTRGVPQMVHAMAERSWRPEIADTIFGMEGATVLIVGYGDIGRALARRLAPFGVRVMAANRGPVADPPVERAFGLDALDAALALADIVVLSVAYVPETHGLISASRLAAMKPGALLVNVSRGGVVDHAALADALSAGRIGGAALDVTDPEPLPPDHGLWRSGNVLVSPHLGGTATAASAARLAALVHDNAMRLRRREPLRGVVRP